MSADVYDLQKYDRIREMLEKYGMRLEYKTGPTLYVYKVGKCMDSLCRLATCISICADMLPGILTGTSQDCGALSPRQNPRRIEG
jgi:hypothetical protein